MITCDTVVLANHLTQHERGHPWKPTWSLRADAISALKRRTEELAGLKKKEF